jgi:hypothetical protein
VWDPKAENGLTQLWLHAHDQQVIADAADQNDHELREDAHRKGRPFRSLRVLEVEPLAALFDVNIADCMARVIAIKRIN